MPLTINSTGQTFTDDELKTWFTNTGGDTTKIADSAVAVGADADEVARAINIGAGYDLSKEYVQQHVDDSMPSYAFDAGGKMTKKPLLPPASSAGTGRSTVPGLPTAPPPSSDTTNSAEMNTEAWRDAAGTPSVTGADAGTATAGKATAAAAAAGNYNITKDALVEDRLEGLLNKDSAYMQRAATAGAQYANKRGLLNSSMGAQAGHAAAIDASLPIAQQDATSYFTAGIKNAELTTQTNIANAQYATQASIENAGNETQASISTAGNQTQAGIATLNAATQRYISDSGIVANFNLEQMRQDNTLAADYWKNIYTMNQNRAASEDALFNATGLNAQEFQNAMKLSEQEFQEAMGMSKQDFMEAVSLSEQEFGQATMLSEQDFVEEMQQLLVKEKGFNDRLVSQIDQQDRQAFTEASGNMTQQYMQEWAKVQATKFATPEAKQQALDDLSFTYEANMTAMAETFKYDIDISSMTDSTDPATRAAQSELETTIAWYDSRGSDAKPVPPSRPAGMSDADYARYQADFYRAHQQTLGAKMTTPTTYFVAGSGPDGLLGTADDVAPKAKK